AKPTDAAANRNIRDSTSLFISDGSVNKFLVSRFWFLVHSWFAAPGEDEPAGRKMQKANPKLETRNRFSVRSLLVIVRKLWSLMSLSRILFQILQQPLNRSFKLRVATLSPFGWIELDFNVGRNSTVLNFPVAFQPVYSRIRCGH